jgi:hypothetical protein
LADVLRGVPFSRPIVTAIVCAAFCVLPSTALGIGYGLSEGVGAFNSQCPNNSCTITYDYFKGALGGSGAQYVRFFVPYDLIATYYKRKMTAACARAQRRTTGCWRSTATTF